MIDLSTGLFVENRKFLIPWGITSDEAWRIGDPAPWNLPEDKLRMKWSGAVILDGLECVIQAHFATIDSQLSALNILDAYDGKRSPLVWAQTLRTHCERSFGHGKDQGAWRQDNITLDIRHDDRFVEAYWLTISLQEIRSQDG